MPAALKKGDTIGLVSPAGPIVDEKNFTAGIRLLKEMGLEVKFARDLPQRKENYLAGPDRLRLDDFHELWADPEVRAVLAVRGGYGSMRIVDRIDYDLIRNNPKILVGFSDVTVLLASIYQRCNLVTMHGPVLTTLARGDRHTVRTFFDTLAGQGPDRIKPKDLEILAPGRARGRLLGGNLTTLAHLEGTPFALSWDHAILFLEDVGESPYRIDRLLTQLNLAGRLDNLAGLILGSFNDGLSNEGIRVDEGLIWQRVMELFKARNIPVWANFPVGHIPDNHILPIGVTVEMNSDAGTLHLSGPAVTKEATPMK